MKRGVVGLEKRRGRRYSLTLPSITATQELVVPRSMPITSLPETNRDPVEL